MSGPSTHLVLCGPMGAGKSRVGRILAGWLGAGFDDLDELIAAREARTIPQLFEQGEPVFRRAEREALAWWLDWSEQGARVLALGGGTLEDPSSVRAVAGRASLVHLDASAEELLSRLKRSEVAARPLLAGDQDPLGRLRALREARAGGYAHAHLKVITSGLAPAEVALEILRALYGPEGSWARQPEWLAGGPQKRDPETVAARAADGGAVCACRGGLPIKPAPRAVLLWDSNLPEGHRRTLLPHLEKLAGGNLLLLEREGGEGVKTPETLLALWRELLAAGIDKDVPMWVAGGGTLTDLGGFLAHTFKRGLRCSLLPTTLLAQLDAGLGGKTGINLDAAKNAVGTIRLPEQVCLDSLFLLTLKPEDLRCGLSEAVKSGLIADPGLVGLIEGNADLIRARQLPMLEEITTRAAGVKLKIVAEDLHESGQRLLLNFGHTLGHAIESVRARAGDLISHGDAVAAGMLFATRLARRQGVLEDGGLISRLESLFASLGLPAGLPPLGGAGPKELLAELRHDKKRRSGENVWVLPRKSGRLMVESVPESDVAATLKEW